MAREVPAEARGLTDRAEQNHVFAALHQGNYATIANYLERELRYMDAGERGSKRQEKLSRQGIPGYQ